MRQTPDTALWTVVRQCSAETHPVIQYYLLILSNGYEERIEVSSIIHMQEVCCDVLRSSPATNSKHSPPQIAPSRLRQLQYRHLPSLDLPCCGTLRLGSTATFHNSVISTSEVPREQPAAGSGWGGSDNVTSCIGGMASVSSAWGCMIEFPLYVDSQKISEAPSGCQWVYSSRTGVGTRRV